MNDNCKGIFEYHFCFKRIEWIVLEKSKSFLLELRFKCQTQNQVTDSGEGCLHISVQSGHS